jgi:multidrug efflux system membrane fusion protein
MTASSSPALAAVRSALVSPRLSRVSLAAVVVAVMSACSPPPEQQMPPQAVSVATVEMRAVTDQDTYIGRIAAVDAVEIRPRVAGYIAGLHFTEGALVKRGELLFSIDDREYVANAAAARADVARADSRIELARQEEKRSQALIEARAVSQGELELRQAELRQAEADLASAKARLAQAELQLEFTRIRSPIDGRVSAAAVRVGSLVGSGEPLLTQVMSVDPIRVEFDADERALLRYRSNGTDAAKAKVDVDIGGAGSFAHSGRLDFIDNALDPRTGTVRMRGELANADGALVPGLTARVRLESGTPHQAVLVHEQALLSDQDRKYVWVLGEGNTAQRKDVQVGASIDGLRVIESGLLETDRVVVNGVRKIFFPGQPLAPVDVPMNDPLQASAQAAAAPAAPAQEG